MGGEVWTICHMMRWEERSVDNISYDEIRGLDHISCAAREIKGKKTLMEGKWKTSVE